MANVTPIYRTYFFFFLFLILLKTYMTRIVIFHEIRPGISLLLEILIPLILAIIIEVLIKKGKAAAYIFLNLIVSIILLAIILYYDFYGTLPTYTSLFQLNQVGEVSDSIAAILKPYYGLLFIDILLFFILHQIKWLTSIGNSKARKRLYQIGLPGSILLVTLAILFNSNIINPYNQAEKMGIWNYQVYSVYNDYQQKSIFADLQENGFDQNMINEIKGIEALNNPDYFGIAENKNILVVQLESIQTFTVGLEVDGKPITPNLNQLIEESFYFPNIFQQIGKGNTSDAEFMLNTSIYPLGSRAMSQDFGNRDIPSLPKILREHNFTSVTFHTNDVHFWYRDRLYESVGFDRYYDSAFFGGDDYIAFGASDEILYKKSVPVLEDIKNQGGNFYANLIAMSSHHPYTLPESKVKIELPEHYQDTAVGDYLTAVHYADYAFGQLVKDLKERNLWDDTLVVVYGDHFGLRLETTEEEKLMEEVLGRPYHRHLDHFKIPLIIHSPGEKANIGLFEHVGGQVDYMPTILNLAGITAENTIMFGQDLFNYRDNLLGVRFYLPTGSFFNEDILFVPGSGFEDGKGTYLNSLETVQDLSRYESDFNRVMDLLTLSDAYVTHLPALQGRDSIDSKISLDGSLQWEHVINGDDFKVVRVNLFSPSIPQYFVHKNGKKLKQMPADHFDKGNLHDFYKTGHLYISIKNSESNWISDKVMPEEIAAFFDNNNYQLSLFENDYNKITHKLASYYEIIKEAGAALELNETLEWEHFSNQEGFKVVRVYLDVPQQNFFVARENTPLTRRNANTFNQGDQSDLYSNGYLYVTINNENSLWQEEAIPTTSEIQTYFKNNQYMFYFDTYNELLR